MYVDLWGWFWDEERKAHRKQDKITLRLVELARYGWAYRRSAQSQMMLQCFEDGAELAIKQSNPCWEIFFTYWSCSTLFYHVDDIQGALERTVKLTSRAHQDQYSTCPIRSRIYFLLADIYYEMDVFGYEDEIKESLDYLEKNIPMDEDTYFRVQHRRADIHFLYERYDESFKGVTAYMAKAQHNDFRMRSAHQLLRAIAFARGELLIAHDHALQAEHYARMIDSHVDVGVSLLWQAALSKRRGNETLAHQTYLQGVGVFTQHQLPHWPDYYNALCDYLELSGEVDKAITQRQQQIEEYREYGSLFYLAWGHLQYCRLLGRTGKDVSEALDSAYKLSEKMRKPANYIGKLERIKAGDYFQHDWQRAIGR